MRVIKHGDKWGVLFTDKEMAVVAEVSGWAGRIGDMCAESEAKISSGFLTEAECEKVSDCIADILLELYNACDDAEPNVHARFRDEMWGFPK